MKLIFIIIFSILTLSLGSPQPITKTQEEINQEKEELQKQNDRKKERVSCLDPKCKLSNQAIEYTKP